MDRRNDTKRERYCRTPDLRCVFGGGGGRGRERERETETDREVRESEGGNKRGKYVISYTLINSVMHAVTV